jgi:tRNA A-37 threonylcarbamoyl transferase component Bud32
MLKFSESFFVEARGALTPLTPAPQTGSTQDSKIWRTRRVILKPLMPVRSALLFIVPLILGLCSYSFSFDVIPRRRPCRSVLHLARRALSGDDKKNLNELLYQAGIDPEQCQVEQLSGPGFCNALYEVQCGSDKMVGKLFSNLAKRRMPLQNRHCIDWMASKRGLGPKVFASTDNGILMEWLEDKSLDETIVHGSVEWVERVAPRLAAFHYMKTPNPPNVLWESIDIMMNMMQDVSLVERQVSQQRQSIEALELPTVLGHGDLKPSNIIGEKTPRFIDFEISGMHYRGFDLAKLFRTKHPTRLTKDNLKRFLECYLRFSPVSLVESDKELDLLRLEAKIMEPLTVRIVLPRKNVMIIRLTLNVLSQSGSKQPSFLPVQLTWTQRTKTNGTASPQIGWRAMK